MSFEQLSNEIVRLILGYLDLPELGSLTLTSRWLHAMADDLFHSRAIEKDKLDPGWPACLAIAGITGRQCAFVRLLAKTDPDFVRPQNIRDGHPFVDKNLLARSWNNHVSLWSTTLLHILSNFGRKDMVRRLLAKCDGGDGRGGYPSHRSSLYDSSKKTPLFRASEMGHLGTMKLLINTGADPSEMDQDGVDGVLAVAIMNGHMAAAEYLITAGANVRRSAYRRHLPLRVACGAGNTHLVYLLLEAGAGADGGLENALFAAASCRTGIPIAQILIDAGAKIHHNHMENAAHDGGLEMLEFLVKNGGRFSHDEHSLPVIHNGKCDHQVLEFVLKDAPELIHKRDTRGLTALDTMYMSNSDSSVTVDRMLPVAMCLIEAGGEVTGINPVTRRTALQSAIRQGHNPVVKVLLGLESQRQQISTRDAEGYTALHYACVKDPPEAELLVAWLLGAGIDVSARSHSQDTALHLVSRSRREDWGAVILALVDGGIDRHVENAKGETALAIASETGNPNVVQSLLEAGLDVSHRDSNGDTPLHRSVKQGIQRHAKMRGYANMAGMIVLGVLKATVTDVCCREFELFPFTYTDHMAVVQHLVSAGADVSLQNNQGYTPLDILAMERIRGSGALTCLEELKNSKAVGQTSEAHAAMSDWISEEGNQ